MADCRSHSAFSIRFVVCSVLLVFAARPVWPQQLKQNAAAAESPNCEFLRSENRRISKEAQSFVENAPLANVKNLDSLTAANSTLADWVGYLGATEVFSARKTILRLEIAACERTGVLSDASRLSEIEVARANQVRRATTRWRAMAGDSGSEFEATLSAQIDTVYEVETKSFYSPAMKTFDDPDIGKDYPDLASAIQASALDQDTKVFYGKAAHLLRYDEAGQLENILRGVAQDRGLNYACITRKVLADRVAADAQRRDEIDKTISKERNDKMTTYAIEVGTALLLGGGLWIWSDRARAKLRAFRKGLKRSSFWFGNAEWIFWERGETVVLLERKRLVPMTDPQGGYRMISAWKEQEYKGRISYKTQFSTWQSDPILTSDGLAVHLGVGIWWKIIDAGKYVSAIASDYHEEDHHIGENLGEAAEFWIKKLAAGTLREEINQLPAEQLISPYVPAYLQVGRGPEKEVLMPGTNGVPNFSQQLGKAQLKLSEKTIRYGIEIERLEVQELILPPIYQQKLEAVRVAFLEPSQARALSEAQVIALQGLAGVIGPEKVGLIEILKHVKTSQLGMSPFTGTVPVHV